MKYLFPIFFLFFYSSGFAQKPDPVRYSDFSINQIDSLLDLMHDYNKYKSMLPFAEAGLSIITNQKQEGDLYHAKMLFYLGLHYDYVIRDLEKAYVYYKKAYDIQRVKCPNTIQYANTIFEIANLLFSLGDYSKAENFYLEVKTISESISGVENLLYITILKNLANLYTVTGNLSQAKVYYLDIKSIYEKIADTEKPFYTKVLNYMAKVYRLTNEFDKAEEIYHKIVKLTSKNKEKDERSYIAALNNLAALFRDTYRFKESEKLYLEARSILENSARQSDSDYAINLNNLAELYVCEGKYAEAEQLYLIADSLWEDKEDLKYAVITNNLGILYDYLGNYKKSEQYFFLAKKVHENSILNDPADYTNVLSNLARLYADEGLWPKAGELFLKSIEYFQEQSNTKNHFYANCLSNLADYYEAIGNYEKAEQLFNESLDIIEETLGKENPIYVKNLSSLASLFANRGFFDKAEVLFNEAVTISLKVLGKTHPDYATSLNNLAEFYRASGNFEMAEQLHLDSKMIREQVLGNRHPDYGVSLKNLADFYESKGMFEQAELLYNEAVLIFEDVYGKEHPVYATSLNSLANLYEDLGQYEKAERNYLLSKSIRAKVLGTENTEYAESLNNLANLYQIQDNFTEAENLYTESIRIIEKVLGKNNPAYATALVNLANLYFDLKNYSRSESNYLAAIEIEKKIYGKDHPTLATTYNNLAALYKQTGNYAEAEKYYLSSKKSREKVLGKFHPSFAVSLNNLADLLSLTGRLDTAQLLYLEMSDLTINYLQKVGKTRTEKGKQELFQSIQPEINSFYAFAAGKRTHDSILIKIQNNSLAMKGFALAGATEILPLLNKLKDSVLNVTYDEWSILKLQLSNAYTMNLEDRIKNGINIDSMEIMCENLESKLTRGSSALKELLGADDKKVIYNDLMKVLNPDEITIDFIRFAEKDSIVYYALVNSREFKYPKFIKLCNESELEEYLLRDVGRESGHFRRSYATDKKLSLQLYNLIWKPLDFLLDKKKVIHLSPVGLLNKLAFSVLQDGNNKMLIEKFELHFYGALKDFVISRRDGKTGNNPEFEALILGNATFDLIKKPLVINYNQSTKDEIDKDFWKIDENFSPLPGTKTELSFLKKALKNEKWKIIELSDSAANETNLKNILNTHPPRIIHLATHGFFKPGRYGDMSLPLLRSGVALAGANNSVTSDEMYGLEDGLWTAYEVANSNLLPVELVVLSACQTAKGEIDYNEGVMGLQRSFKIAGVEYLILSLWNVPDKETTELMQYFYSFYLKGMKPNAALRKAQIIMKKKYPNPYYWAAFMLIE